MYLQRMGFFNGYEIVGSDDKKECELCDRMQGKYVRLTDMTPLPPFHPNCRCRVVLGWKSVANLDEIYRYFYDPDTGEIRSHAGYEPTIDLIRDAINYFLEKNYGENKNLTWKEIVALGFVNSDGVNYLGETYDAEFLVGQRFVGAKWNVFSEDKLEKMRSGEEEDQYDFYNPKTGEISLKSNGEIPTKDEVTEEINYYLVNNFNITELLTWEEIAWFGLYDAEGNELNENSDVSKIIGGSIMLDMTNILDVNTGSEKESENILNYWIAEAKKDGENFSNSYFNNFYLAPDVALLGYYALVDTYAKYDLKNHNGKHNEWNNCFGDRKYQGYVWDGKLLPYDAPGNIVVGVLAYFMGIPLNIVLKGVDVLAGGDDPRDQEYIEYGYNLFKDS